MRRPSRRVSLEVTLLEGKMLLSSATGHDVPAHAAQCSGAHFMDLNGKITGYFTPVGSTLQLVSTAGNLEEFGRVKATGAFTLKPNRMIRSGQIVLSTPGGSLDLKLVETNRSPLRRNGPFTLRLTTGHGTGRHAHHCSEGSVVVALHEKRSHFVAMLTTTTPVVFLPPGWPPFA
jgi:hypothetical protein